MPRFVFSSLRVRLICLGLLAIVPALGLLLYTGFLLRQSASAAVKAETLRLTRLAAGNQDRLVEGARQLLTALAELPQVRAGDQTACSALFASLLDQYPLYANLGAADAEGNLVCSALPITGSVNLADRSYFTRAVATRAFAIGNYQIGRVTGRPSVNFGYPVLDAAGQVQGVVFVALDLSWLNQLAAEAQLPDGASLVVIDHNGVILARYPDSQAWVGQSLPEVPIIQSMLSQAEGTVAATGVDGVERLYAFTTLGDPAQAAAHVAIGIPLDAAYAQVDRALILNLLSLGLVALLALVAAWLAGDAFVVRHVRSLEAAARRLAAGDLSARAPVPDHAGELGHLAGVFNQMAAALEHREADRRQAEAALRDSETRYRQLSESLERRVAERTAQLEAANKELEAFSFSVSHDLRAPLRSLDGFSQALLEDYEARLDAEGQSHLHRIRAAAQRMGQLIDDLLKLSRVTRSEVQVAPVDLSGIARQILADLQQAEPARRVEAIVQNGIVVQGDARLLRVALENLLRNAWKFTGRQDSACIEFGVQNQAGELVCFVRDNGAGFDMAYAARLFGAFQRLHSVDEFPGTGVGLATVQRIIHRHGGRVWAEGSVGQGATFYFALRIAPAPENEFVTGSSR